MAWAYDVEKARLQTVLGHAAESAQRGRVDPPRLGVGRAPRPAHLIRRSTAREATRSAPAAMDREPPAAAGAAETKVLPADPGLEGGVRPLGQGGRERLGRRAMERGRRTLHDLGAQVPDGTILGRFRSVGDGGVVFDADLCTSRAGWAGGFLVLVPRYGLIEMRRARS
jgi:hypothetical protein